MRAEDAIRLEFKLDLIIEALQRAGAMLGPGDLPQLNGIQVDNCPVCQQIIRLSIVINTEEVVRRCGCSLPIAVVPGISALTKPPEESNGRRTREEESDLPPDSEEGGPSISGCSNPAGAGN